MSWDEETYIGIPMGKKDHKQDADKSVDNTAAENFKQLTQDFLDGFDKMIAYLHSMSDDLEEEVPGKDIDKYIELLKLTKEECSIQLTVRGVLSRAIRLSVTTVLMPINDSELKQKYQEFVFKRYQAFDTES